MANEEKIESPALTFEEFVKRPPVLTVLTDHPLTPSEAFDADTFNFRYRLGPVFDILRHPDTKTPATILISGGWGTGKTSAMKWLQGLLGKWNEEAGRSNVKVRPVWFYPWKYDNKADVRRGLIAEVIINAIYISNPEDKKITISGKKILTGLKLLGSFGLNVVGDLVTASEYEIPTIPGLKVSGEVLKEIRKHYSEAAHPEAAFLNELEETMKHWVKESLGKNQRMVIFIDDLDRCMPEIGLQVLEALKLYLNIPNLIFVLGVDKGVIKKLVIEHYKNLGLVRVEKMAEVETEEQKPHSKQDEEKAKQYLSKMFQVEVTLDPSEQQISEFFTEQLKGLTYWNEEYLSTYEQELFRDLVLKFADQNPREVKRLLNSSMLAGAGAILIEGDDLTFAQGMQLFFVRKVLDKNYTSADVLDSNNCREFFRQWSSVLRKNTGRHESFPFTVKVPAHYIQRMLEIAQESASTSNVEGVRNPELVEDFLSEAKVDELDRSFARDEYHQLLKDLRFPRLFHLLADEKLGRLMLIEFPMEERGGEIINIIGRSDDATILLNAIARMLNKAPSEVTHTDCESLQELDLSFSSFSDMRQLISLKSLKKLVLYDTSISDIKPLADLTNLQELHLDGTPIVCIDSLGNLTKLENLTLAKTKVADLDSLVTLKSLRGLNVSGTQVSNITSLTDMINLRWLMLSATHVSKVGALSGLTDLRELRLAATLVNAIEPLQSLKSLQELDLSATRVIDISALSGLKNLQRLSISDTDVSDISSLSSLMNLQLLFLSRTNIIDINILSKLTNLQTLNLSGTRVSDISALSGLMNLQVLRINGTRVNDIGVLSGLTNFQLLDISNTNVSDEQVDKLKKALPKMEIVR